MLKNRFKVVDMNPKWEMEHGDSFTSPDSSTIHSVRYFEDKRLLVVLFKFEKTGGIKSVYYYEHFAPSEWAKFYAANSKGAWFNAHIRPIYEGRKIA